MTCSKCGQTVLEGDKFCGQCGERIESVTLNRSEGYTPIDESNQTKVVILNDVHETSATDASVLTLPMRWYKFIIYFWLPVAVIRQLITAYELYSGYDYMINNIDRNIVYSRFPSLQSVDFVFIALALGMSVFAFVVQRKLSKFQINGPASFIYYLFADLAYGVAYYVITRGIIGYYGDAAQLIGTILGVVIFALINRVYFNKRKTFFYN